MFPSFLQLNTVLYRIRTIIGIFLLFLLLTRACSAAAPTVWVEDNLTHVMKTDPAKTASTITLYTAKNEYEPFQIIVKAPSAHALNNVTVAVSSLTGPNGASISADNLILYRAHYVTVTQGSTKHTGDTNHPLGPGLYPDALIPFVDPVTKQDLNGTLNAAPFTVAANQNQPIWVDIYTPATTPAGQYTGTATVTSAEGTAMVQVILNVWNFTLPKTRSLKGFTTTVGAYRNTMSAIELLKHRINPRIVATADERFLIDRYGLDMIGVFPVSGANRHTCVTIPPPSVAEWQAEVARHQPDLTVINSYTDEVSQCASVASALLDWANNLRQASILPMMTSSVLDAFMGPDLNHTAGDIWSFLPKHYDESKANIDKLKTNPKIQIWPYNPLVQEGYAPKYTIDFLPINFRILQGFMNQSMGFHGTRFWRVDNWTTDPWNNAEASRPDAPGEGHMVYRGDDVGLPNQIVSGIRMKGHREGSEDYEYIEILKSRGHSPFALATSRTVATDFRTWTKDKNVLFAARKLLGDRIHALSTALTPTVTTPPPTITPSVTISPTPCPFKKNGDANCKKDPAGGSTADISLLDFNIWRSEFFAGCSQASLAVCQPDNDTDPSSPMDANFDYPGSSHPQTNTTVAIADFEIWRKGCFTSGIGGCVVPSITNTPVPTLTTPPTIPPTTPPVPGL